MQQKCEYTHHLPYSIRSQLCNLLDADQSWRQLGGKFGLSGTQLSLLGQAYMRLNGSPANELLNKLDSSNVRIHDLCKCLSEISHWRAVELLQSYESNQSYQQQQASNGQIMASMDGSATLVTPTPSFLNCKDSSGVDDSYMQSMSNNSTITNNDNTNGNILMTPQISTWVSKEDHHQYLQQALPIMQATQIDQQQQQQQPMCHKQQQQQHQQIDNQYFNSSPKKEQAEEDKIRKACVNNKQRTSLTDGEIVNQLRLIMQINYKELKVASDNFSATNIIGNGGFASVYRGNLKGTEVAIKRLKCNLVDQALNELTIMNSYRIDNILPIYGISIDGPEACLVYQYMSNGSLEDRLLCKNNSAPLSWKQRALIGEGIAKSLYYLHTLRDKPLVHGDVKSANVLLDAQFVPKLGDFGLARQVFKGIKGKEMLTHCTVSSINGTSVYLPAEYLRHRILSPAVDVYSYGIVLLEMGTGKRAYDGKRLLIDRVEDETSSISSGQIDLTLKDHRVQDNSQAGLKIWYELMIKLGLECAHRIKKKRPDMGQVLARYATFWNDENEKLANDKQLTDTTTATIPTTVANQVENNNATNLNNNQEPMANNIDNNLLINTNINNNNNNNIIDNDNAQMIPKYRQQPITVQAQNQIQRGHQQQTQHQDNNIINQHPQPQTLQQNLQYNNDAQIQQQQQQLLFYNDNNDQQNILNGPPHEEFNQQIRPTGALYNPQYNQNQHLQYQPNNINGGYQMSPINENYAYAQADQHLQQRQQQQTILNQQQYIQYNSSIMLVEDPNQQEVKIANNQGNGYTTVDKTNNQMINSDHGASERQQDQRVVDAMIPLLTELGIGADQSD